MQQNYYNNIVEYDKCHQLIDTVHKLWSMISVIILYAHPEAFFVLVNVTYGVYGEVIWCRDNTCDEAKYIIPIPLDQTKDT